MIFGLIEGLILIRFILKALGANPSAGFAQFIYGITAPLVAPFYGLFGNPSAQGSVLELHSIVALIVYALLAWLILKLGLRLPTGWFFGLGSALMAVLAVVLAGKGIAALQHAGKLPAGPLERAKVRALAQLIACDIHPLNNVGPLRHLKNELGQDQSKIDAWYHHWVAEGFEALEALMEPAPYAFGNTVTLADLCLVPQVYNARRLKVPLDRFPKLIARSVNCPCCAATKQSSIACATRTPTARPTIRAAPFSEWAARMQASS